MNNYTKSKLGLPYEDNTLITEIKSDIESYAPIKLTAEQSESRTSDQSIKTINVGTIKNPKYVIVGNVIGTDSFYSIQNPDIRYFFGRASHKFVLNGQLYIYRPELQNLNPDNPYDPIFSSFNRLTSFSPRLVQSGKLTGIPSSVSLITDSGNYYGAIYVSTTDGQSYSGFAKYHSGSWLGQTYDFYRYNDVYYSGRSGSRDGYTFGTHIDHFYFSKVMYYKDTADYVVFDKKGELGYSGKWVGLTTNFTNLSSLHNRLLTQNQVAQLVTVVSTASGQTVNQIPTTAWSGINQPLLKLEINNIKSRLTPITTGWLSSKIEMGGRQKYLSDNKNSFTSGYGFFKIATTRQSYDVNHIYARVTGASLQVGAGSGPTPSGYSKVTYPHSYTTKSFGALRHDVIIVPELTYGTGSSYVSGRRYVNSINDIILISTGISSKKIVYISPNSITTFTGYWSETGATNRNPKPYIRSNGQTGFTERFIYNLNSGQLLSVTSNGIQIPVKEDYTVTGYKVFPDAPERPIKATFIYSNVPESMLKTTTPIMNNNFYKLYEPIYRPNAFNTGTWNGIIPSGTPFQIEIIRTSSNQYGINNVQLSVYAKNFFGNQTGINGFELKPVELENGSKLGLFGVFEGRSTVYTNDNQSRASYLASNKSYNLAISKINGALWDKGMSVQNSKARKTIKLFNGGGFPFKMYSYTTNGVKNYEFGIKTAGGLRTPDGDIIETTQELKQEI